MSNIHLLNESSISNLKLKAKRLSRSESISASSALNKIAISIGFPDWKAVLNTAKFESSGDLQLIISNTDAHLFSDFNELNRLGKLNKKIIQSKYSSLITEQYTDLQKIGAISRYLGLNPQDIKNTIHVMFLDQEETSDITNSDWEGWGFYRDYGFSKWLFENDPFFEDAEFSLVFRMLSIDTSSFERINEFLFSIHESTDLMYPLAIDHVWINGKIDPQSVSDIEDEIKEFFPNSPIYSNDTPLSEVPAKVWKRGY